MYKVFVNEKKLSLGNIADGIVKILEYDGPHTLEMAMDLLENTSCPELAVSGAETEEIWAQFRKMFRIVEAAGGIVKNSDGNFLFIHRLGKWDLPKGKMEKGESREEAAIRELEEETALTGLEIERFINTTYHVYTERNNTKVLKSTHWFLMNYSGTAAPQPQLEEGITEACWKNKTQIEDEVLPATFRNIGLILAEAGII